MLPALGIVKLVQVVKRKRRQMKWQRGNGTVIHYNNSKVY